MSRGGHIGRRLPLALLLASAGLIGASAAPAGAAVTIGETFPPEQSFGGAGVFIQIGSPGNSYTVPSDGVITSWSFEAHPTEVTPPLKLKMMRHVTGDDYLTVGDSQRETVMLGVLNTWPTRIAVKAGDFPAHGYSDTTLGYRSPPGYVTTEISGNPGDPGLDPPPGTTTTFEPPSSSSHQIDVSAVLEPDADRDAFGDETQDKCLGTPGSFSGCPSTIQLNSVKQKKGAAKIRVNMTVPGAGTVAAGSPGDKALASIAKKKLKAKTRTETVTGSHGVSLTLKLTKATAERLATSGKLKVKVKAVYTPPGGPPASQTKKKKLKS
jgi:hypothetical protein